MAITPHHFQLVAFCLHIKVYYKSYYYLRATPYSYIKINCLISNIQRKFWESSIKCYINRHCGEDLGQSVMCSYKTLNKSQLYRTMKKTQLLDSCIMMNFTFHWTIGEWFNFLMTTMEILLKKLVCSSFNHLTQCELVLLQWHCCCCWWLLY